eukprot:scaffold8514_cov55-Phaeocystis_antarctica.AAC.10
MPPRTAASATETGVLGGSRGGSSGAPRAYNLGHAGQRVGWHSAAKALWGVGRTEAVLGSRHPAAPTHLPRPAWSNVVKSAALEAARSSTRGSGWAPSGPASSWDFRAAQSRQA